MVCFCNADEPFTGVRLVGSKKFVEVVESNSSSGVDNSFESVEDLTQKVMAIEKCTPQRK